jgi:hypothetical protein
MKRDAITVPHQKSGIVAIVRKREAAHFIAGITEIKLSKDIIIFPCHQAVKAGLAGDNQYTRGPYVSEDP